MSLTQIRSVTCRFLAFSCGLDGRIDFRAMAGNDGIQLLLDFTKNPGRIHPREIPVHMLVNDFNEREQFGQ